MSNSKFKVNYDDVVAAELEDEAVLLNLKTRFYYSTNATGLRIWQLLDDGLDTQAITATLANEFDAPLATIAADVEAWLKVVVAEKLASPL